MSELDQGLTQRRVPARRLLGHDGAAPTTELDEPLVTKLLIPAQDGVDVDTQRVGEVPGSGKPFARDDVALRHSGTHAGSQLSEQRLSRIRIQSDKHRLSLLF